MNNECGIVRDLLPLYAETMESPESKTFIEAHLAGCADCRAELEALRRPDAHAPTPDGKADVAPLRHLRRTLRTRRALTIVFTASLVCVVLACAFAFLTAPEYLPYTADRVEVVGDKGDILTLRFNETVTRYSVSFIKDEANGVVNYHITAWRTTLDGWFGIQADVCTLGPLEDLEPVVYYNQSSNDGHFDSREDSGDVPIYGESGAENVCSLPRLTLTYYLVGAAALATLLATTLLVFRKRETARRRLLRATLAPVSYLVAHVSVLGLRTSTYSLQRDLAFILLIATLLWCAVLLGLYLLRVRRSNAEVAGR